MADLVVHLVTNGIVDFLSMDSAVQQMHRIGGRLASNILETSKIEPDKLLEAISDFYEMDYAPTSLLATVDPDVVQFWQLDTALRLGAIPLALNRHGLTLGVLEPLSHVELAEVKEEYGSKITQLLMFEFRFFEMCNRFLGVVLDQRYARWVSKYPIDGYEHLIDHDLVGEGTPLEDDLLSVQPTLGHKKEDDETRTSETARYTGELSSDPEWEDPFGSMTDADSSEELLFDQDSFANVFGADPDTNAEAPVAPHQDDHTPPSGLRALQLPARTTESGIRPVAAPTGSNATSTSGTYRFGGEDRHRGSAIPFPSPELARKLGLTDEYDSWSAIHSTLDRLSDEERSYSTKITTIDIRTFYQQAQYIEDFLYPTLSYFNPFFKRRFLMHFWQPYKTSGMLMQGVREHDVPFTRVEVPYDDNSAVNKMRISGNFLKGTPVDIGFLTLYSRIGIPKAQETIVMPIRIEGQISMILVLDQGPDAPLGSTLHPGEINLILQQLGQALTIFARSPKKERQPAPVEPDSLEQAQGTPFDLVPQELIDQAELPAASDSMLELAMDSMQLDPVDDEDLTAFGLADPDETHEPKELSKEALALIDHDTRHNDQRAVSIILADDERSDADIALDLIPHSSSDLIRLDAQSDRPDAERQPARDKKKPVPTITAKHERFIPVQPDEPTVGATPQQDRRITTESAPHILQDPIERELRDLVTSEQPQANDRITQDAPTDEESVEQEGDVLVEKAPLVAEHLFDHIQEDDAPNDNDPIVVIPDNQKAQDTPHPDPMALPPEHDIIPARKKPNQPSHASTAPSQRAPAATAQWNARDLARLLRLASTISPLPKPEDTPGTIQESQPENEQERDASTASSTDVSENTNDHKRGESAQSVDNAAAKTVTAHDPPLQNQDANADPNPTPNEAESDDDAHETLILSPKKLIIPDALRTPGRSWGRTPTAPSTQSAPQASDWSTSRSEQTEPEDSGDTLYFSPAQIEDEARQELDRKHSATQPLHTGPQFTKGSQSQFPPTQEQESKRGNGAPTVCVPSVEGTQQSRVPASTIVHASVLDAKTAETTAPEDPFSPDRRAGSTKPLTITPLDSQEDDAPLSLPRPEEIEDAIVEVEAENAAQIVDQLSQEVAEEIRRPKAKRVALPPPPPPADVPPVIQPPSSHSSVADRDDDKREDPRNNAPDTDTSKDVQRAHTPVQVHHDTTETTPEPADPQRPEWFVQLTSQDEIIHKHALTQLLQAGQQALPDIRTVFPGPVTIERTNQEESFTPIGKHGPLLMLIDARLYDFVPQLWEIVENGHSDARYYALRHLALIRTIFMQHALLTQCALDADPQVRKLALEMIDSFRQRPEFNASIQELQRRLGDQDANIQVRAIEALTTLHHEASIPQMIDMLDVQNQEVKQAVHDGLMHLTCIDVGQDKDAWTQWYALHGNEEPGEWLVDAMDAIDPMRRALAQRALTNIRELIVNYHPDMNSTGLRRARMTVERYFGLRR